MSILINRRISVLAVIAGSIISAAACGGHSTPPLGGPAIPRTSSSSQPSSSSSSSHGPTAPVYSADVPTISDGTNRVLIGRVPVAFASKVTDATWSPGGTRLAYVDGDGNIATARPDGTGVLVLTAAKAGVKRAQPAFEDGGGEIVFSERGTDGVWRLMSVSANGHDFTAAGTPTEALTDSIGDGTADTAPSAAYNQAVVKFGSALSTLAYQHRGAVGPEIWVLDRNQRGPRGTKARDGAQPAVSADASTLAFVGGDGQLYTEALPITTKTKAVRITLAVTGLTHPVWSPDGTRLAFGTATNVESVSSAAPHGASGNPVRVESASPGTPGYEPMKSTSLLRYATGDPVTDSIAQSRAYYTAARATGVPPTPTGEVYTTTVTLVGTADPAALTVAGLSYGRGPILFTRPDVLSSATTAEIKRLLGPATTSLGDARQTVRILGDTRAVSASIAAALDALGYKITRIPDADPIAAAVALNGTNMDASSGWYTLFLVSATDTPAIASLEAGGFGGTILFTDGSTMPSAVETIINRLNLTRQNPVKLMAVGGQAQAAVASSWPGKPANVPVTRLGGSDAYLNSLLITKQYSDGPAELALAATDSWQDALLASANGPGMPLLVVDPRAGLGAEATRWLDHCATSVSTVVLYGDTSAVPTQLAAEVADALHAPAGVSNTLNPGRLPHL